MGYQRGNSEWNMFPPSLVIEDDHDLEKTLKAWASLTYSRWTWRILYIYFDITFLSSEKQILVDGGAFLSGLVLLSLSWWSNRSSVQLRSFSQLPAFSWRERHHWLLWPLNKPIQTWENVLFYDLQSLLAALWSVTLHNNVYCSRTVKADVW